jgi:polyphenol oxidase
MPPNWLQPDWPAPNNVRALFTTRHGGASSAPWASMNLGDHVGDAPHHVGANRATLQQAIGCSPVFLKQVHGTDVVGISAWSEDGLLADGCVTTQPGVACTIMVADCLPVLFSTRCGSVVAAAHAGWRGLAGSGDKGVLENTRAAICASFVPLPQSIRAQAAPEIIAWLGPCIGPVAFEVGAEVKAAFIASQAGAATCFKPAAQGKYTADLAALARLRLRAMGITQIYGNDSSQQWCTASNPSIFFSHRRDAGVNGNGFGNGFGTTGRMAGCIWMNRR